MTVREIFDLPSIKEIEKNILDIQRDIEVRRCGSIKNGEDVIRSLLKILKHLLDNEFVMDGNYKQLFSDFNDSLRQQLIEMRNKGIEMYNAVKVAGICEDVEVLGKCYLGYEFSRIHPIQTIRAKKMWCMLNETLDNYNAHYENGVIDGWGWLYPRDKETDTENYMLYLNSSPDNWNDWFIGKGRKFTDDMHMIHPVHHLLDYTSFSIFDLLWVRDFSIEITVETDCNTYKTDYQGDDLDWSKYDYSD